jgi:hypothetical protein
MGSQSKPTLQPVWSTLPGKRIRLGTVPRGRPGEGSGPAFLGLGAGDKGTVLAGERQRN